MKINLNADLGESFGPWTMGDDGAMLGIVNSASIACGAHAGDPEVMRRTVRLALQHGVSLGAHPSYPDLQGFGRRVLPLTPLEVEAQVAFQVGALCGVAALEGGRVTHVKPHGALNNRACEDRALAAAVCRAVRCVDPQLILLAPACSELLAAARDAGLPTVVEIFADRTYQSDGTLTPRKLAGSMLHDADSAIAHVLGMLAAGALIATDGTRLPTTIGSICVHGDNPGAVAIARALREALLAHGHTLATLPDLVAAN